MFLSDAQIDLIDSLAHIHPDQRLDILDCNVSTVSALSVRGITQVNYASKAGDVTNVAVLMVKIEGQIGFLEGVLA